MLALQRTELDERSAELRKALAERAASIRDSIADELGELQRQLRAKAAVADVHGAAAELRATLGASQEARLAELRAETHASTQEALVTFRKNVRRTLAHAGDELKVEMKAAVHGQVADALAVGAAELSDRIGAKADADALDAAQRALAVVERELVRKVDGAQLDEALGRVEARVSGGLGDGESAAAVLRRVDEALARAAPADELARQRAVLEPVWAECQTCRFAWASHKLRSTGRSTLRLVPWDVQRINTDPLGFGWDQLSPAVTVAQPGPYELTLAFFSRVRRPRARAARARAPRARALTCATAARGALRAAPTRDGSLARERCARAREELGRAGEAHRRNRSGRGRRCADGRDAAARRAPCGRVCGR